MKGYKNICMYFSKLFEKVGTHLLYEFGYVFLVCFSCVSCGSFLGYTSSALPSIAGDATFTIYDYHSALIGGLGPLGALFGSLLTPLPLRYLNLGSRRTILTLGMPPLLLSWVIIGFLSSSKVEWILIGRFIGGVGVGATISCAPLYVMEVAGKERRGRLGIMPQFLMIFGILLAYIGGSQFNWKQLARVGILFPSLASVFLLLAPDSPKWLLDTGRTDKALKILENLNRSEEGRMTFEQKTASVDQVKENEEGQQLCSKGNLKAFGVCLIVISIQQFTGINGVTFFALSIFSPSEGESSGHIPSIILASTQLLASLISTFFVERFGRKPLLILSCTIVFISTSLLGAHFFLVYNGNELPIWFPLLTLIIFAFGFAIGLGPLCWILIAELLPPLVRQLLNPLVIGYNWLCIFLITSSFPLLRESVNLHGIFWIYASVAFLGLIFIIKCVPETKPGKAEKIEDSSA